MCCEDARKMDGALAGEYDSLVTDPRNTCKKNVEAEFGYEGVSISYTPPEEHRSRIGEIVALRRRLSDGWCPAHSQVH